MVINALLIVVLIVISITIVFLIYFFLSFKEKSSSLDLVQKQMDSLRNQVNESIGMTVQSLNQQFSSLTNQINMRLKEVTDQMFSSSANTSKIFADVREKLGALTQQTNRIIEVGKDIATLQDILKAPKLRGSLGELLLGDLLSQILPTKFYVLQYRFKNNVQVDAVIKLAEGYIVPVDSKFPLSSFKLIMDARSEEERNRAKKRFISDVKKHIDAIAERYILPDEGTLDFALMYIPAENVYYETIIKDESLEEEGSLFTYSLNKRVIPVSPNSFYAYLQTILLGLKRMEIAESAKKIYQFLMSLQGDFERLEDDFRTLGGHLQNARRKFEETERKFDRLKERLSDIGSGKILQEPEKTELPPQKTLFD
ncbi:MAG: DNA recombination protein RmuC [Candidatus Aminicenantia bacterium]